MENATLGTKDLDPLLKRLDAARLRLAERPLEDRIAALEILAQTWLDDTSALEEAATAIATETGYAPAMVSLCLQRTLTAWGAPHLRDLVTRTISTSNSQATAPEMVVAVLAQNTPGLAIAPTFSALALGASIILKSSHGEGSFAPRLVERIRATDSGMGDAIEACRWPGGDPLENVLFPRASRVVVYGPSEAIARARDLAGERVIACGPRVSVAVVGDGACPETIAAALAHDIAFLDQRGCLSPQTILVDESVDRNELARALAGELAATERVWPRRKLSSEETGEFRRARQETETRVLAGAAEALLGQPGDPWAVAVEQQTQILPTPLDRFIRLHPFRGATQLREALSPLRGHLECVGFAGDDTGNKPLHQVARSLGASRICSVGDMQDPPADWHAGGSRPLSDYLCWSNSDPDHDAAGHTATDTRQHRFRRWVAQTSDEPRSLDVERARGSWVYTRDGRRHLDLLAGIGVASIGHTHPNVASAVARQSAQYTHVMVYGEDILTPQVDLAERLAKLLPPSLSVTYFTNSGAEAIEGSLKLVRKATGRHKILAFEGAYHGDTTGAMAIGGNPYYRKPFEPLLEPMDFLPWNDPNGFGKIDESTAAVFVEPVQAEGGVRIPSPEFLPDLARRCRDVGALLVFDEVVTGLGRTGRWFGFEHWPGSEPDVLVLAKSLGGGLPLGAFLASPELMRVLAQDPPLGHVTTFGGNPVSCAAGLAALDVLENQALPERAARTGARLLQEIECLRGDQLAAVRGIGMLIGLEFRKPEQAASFAQACREEGLLLGWTLHEDRVIRLAPPLTLSESEIEHATTIMGRILRPS